jgi:hypothetical protein
LKNAYGHISGTAEPIESKFGTWLWGG